MHSKKVSIRCLIFSIFFLSLSLSPSFSLPFSFYLSVLMSVFFLFLYFFVSLSRPSELLERFSLSGIPLYSKCFAYTRIPDVNCTCACPKNMAALWKAVAGRLKSSDHCALVNAELMLLSALDSAL